ncbi:MULTISPECIES: glycerate kinase [unclassified Nitrosospira]|uniref:glycerate kinase type-2 family protein n=1 Tax=unclassified Nitrosospira TaxID=2609267 RepID=UPI000D2F7CCA|nr:MULTISPECIES: glycerate kinase [unclassified Nitrosospira]PTR16937.1 hydroxypyruvate reductase [Nitrosospira sp. Nsp2]WON74679.1 glycerate kinase [Nitrosospira sp. Is2]
MVQHDACALLLRSFEAAVAAADPLRIVPLHLPSILARPPAGRTLVVGAGKAAAAMALAVERHWPETASLEGLVLTRYGHSLPLDRIKVIEAGHPLPDEHGEQGTRTILAEVEKLGADDLLLCLLSGGGSSLLTLPVENVTLNDLKKVTAELLRCGAAIQEINTVRKHLSAIQGGRLAAASQAPVLALIISDVTGDDPTHIASGPCAPDPTTYSDALEVIEGYNIDVPAAVMATLQAGVRGELDETPKPGSPAFERVENRVIATARDSLLAAAEYLAAQGIDAAILGHAVTGEARDVAKVFAALAKHVRQYQQPWKTPAALISGGETTVTIDDKNRGGRGGRNTEFLLSLAVELGGMENTYALAGDTDGIDGTENNAGAIVTPHSLRDAKQKGLDAAVLLATHDAYAFFQELDHLVLTGPTRTNVNDYRVILIL